jgi:hypothetical protein
MPVRSATVFFDPAHVDSVSSIQTGAYLQAHGQVGGL